MVSNRTDRSDHPSLDWIFKIRPTGKTVQWLFLLLMGCSTLQLQAGIFDSKKPATKTETKPASKVASKASAALKKKELKKAAAAIAEEGSFSFFTDDKPRYPGGNGALKKFIKNSIKYPYTEEDIYGTVVCNFIINLDGTISSINLVEGLELHFDTEAMRVVRSLPNWIPGKKKGIPVRAYQTVKIKFKRQKHDTPDKKSFFSKFKSLKNPFKKPGRRLENRAQG